MTRPGIASLAFIVAAAASFVHGRAARAQQSPASVRLPGYDLPVVLDSLQAERHHENATRAVVLGAASAALEEHEIPITFADPYRGILLNAELAKTRRLGKYRLSQIVDCGTNLNGAIADQFRVRMGVAVIVDSLAPSESDFRVVFAASAQSVEGATRPPVACSSTGRLEERLAKLVEKKISR